MAVSRLQGLQSKPPGKGLLQISSLLHPRDYSSLYQRVREKDLRKPSSEISGADYYQKNESSGGDGFFHKLMVRPDTKLVHSR